MPQAITTSSGTGWGVTGFNRDPVESRSPRRPTRRAGRPPLFEFAPQRLVDLDGDGFPSYVDPLSANNVQAEQHPYAYFSSYGNNGYDPNDVQLRERRARRERRRPAGRRQPSAGTFTVSFAVEQHGHPAPPSRPRRTRTRTGDATRPARRSPWVNPQSFQIISAGRDGLWGLGGAYDASSTSGRLPVFASDQTAVTPNDTTNAEASSLRVRERDNITNFSGGRLD